MNLQPPDPPEEDEGERWERHLLAVEADNTRLHEIFLCGAHELGLPVEVDAPQVVEAIHALQLENGRLRGLLAEKLISQTMLTGIIPDDGGMTIGLEGGACAIMADCFGEQLYTSGAENYIEAHFTSGKYPDLGHITVTVKRETGKTPHQLRLVAEGERDRLKAECEQLSETCMSQEKLIETLRANP